MSNINTSDALKIGFAGTPEFALPALKMLADSKHQLVAVYTQPDRPAGRGRKTRPSVVKQLALDIGVPVFQPESLKTADALSALQSLDLDVLVVVAYGLLLPPDILATPRAGCLNIHGSLLPSWRGAAPLQRAMLAGDAETGITIMKMNEGLDTGPMLIQRACTIEPDDTCAILHDRLAELGANTLYEVLQDWCDGNIQATEQNDQVATYAAKLNKAEALIDWTAPADQIDRRIRAFNPWPVAHTLWKDKSIRLWMSTMLETDSTDEFSEFSEFANKVPGTVVGCSSAGIDVLCGSGIVRLLQIQLPGKRPVSSAEFANGRDICGDILGIESLEGALPTDNDRETHPDPKSRARNNSATGER